MSAVIVLTRNLIFHNPILKTAQVGVTSIRNKARGRIINVEVPKPGEDGISYRRIVHYPEKYTVEPLQVTNLAGRDPVTGRVVANGIGGGIKHKYHWVKFLREGPKEDVPPQLEKVIEIIKCGCRTADVALVAVGDEMKYILATENMKAGDILKTSMFVPRIPVRASEGDAFPLGALPLGTIVHNVQKYPNSPYTLIHSAGNFGTIKKHISGRIIVQLPSKKEIALPPECMATVGRLCNIEHDSTPVGSAMKNRELGNRPRSGLWQRKGGRHGRKIKPLPPPHFITLDKPEPQEVIRMTHDNYRL